MAIQKFYFHDATTSNSGTLPSGEHSASSPSVTATGATTQRTMDGTAGSSQTSGALTSLANTSAQPSLFRMFESGPLAAQTIAAGTWQLSMAAKEANAAANMRLCMCLYAWRPGTGAVVGSAIVDSPSTNSGNVTEPGTTQTAVTDTSISGSAVTVQDGDILVCEIWHDSTVQGGATARLETFYYDGATEASTTDCASFMLAPSNVYMLGDAVPTLSRVSGYPQGNGAGSTNQTSLAINPGSAVGDVLFIFVGIASASITSTGVSSSRTSGWTKVESFVDSTSGWTGEIWQGHVDSTGTHTVTVTYSGSVASIITEIDADSYHSSLSSPVWWIPASGGRHAASGTSNDYPTLTPSVDGNQAYLGMSSPANGGSAGSTSGYTYDLPDAAWIVMALSIGVVGSQTPNAGQSPAGTSTLTAIIFSDAPISGTGGANLKKSSLSGSGTVGAGGVTGTGSIRLKKPSLSVAAKETESGTGSVSLKKPSISISAKETESGTGSVGLKKPSISIAAAEKFIATGSMGLKKPSLSGSGTVTNSADSGTGSVSLKKPSLSVSAKETISGTGSIRLKKPVLSVAAKETEAGTGSAGLKKPSLSATGTEKLPSGGWTNNYEGTDGTAVSSGNSGGSNGQAFASVNIVASGTYAYSNTHAAHGATSVKIATGATSGTDWAVWKVPNATATYYFRAYLYFTANPSGSSVIVAKLEANGGGNQTAVISVTTGGKIQVLDANSSSIFSTTSSIPLNQWFRLEGFVTGDASVGQAEIKLYNLADSPGTPDETKTSAATFNTRQPPGQIDWGTFGSNIVAHWMDDIGLSDTGYLGPAKNYGWISLKKSSLSGSGTETISGTGSIGLKKPSLSASGTEKISGTGSVAMHKMGVSLAGEEFISGDGGVSLKKPSLSLAAEEIEKGTGSIRLKKPSLSGTGTQKGFGGVHLKKPSLSGSGTVTALSGVGSMALKKPHISLAGTEKISGTGSAGLKKPALSASAVEKEAGTGSVNLHKPSLDASGTEKFIGTGSCGLKKPALSASGGETISGDGSISLHKPSIALAAPQPVTGTGSANLKKPALSASGTEKFIGTGSAGLKKPSISLSSTEFEAGTGDVHLHKMSISAAGSEKISATGSARLHKMSIHAEGPQNSIGSGGVHLHKMSISADGYEAIEGSGGVRLKKPHIHAAQGSAPSSAMFMFWPV